MEQAGCYDESISEDEMALEDRFGVQVPKNVWIIKPGENSNRG